MRRMLVVLVALLVVGVAADAAAQSLRGVRRTYRYKGDLGAAAVAPNMVSSASMEALAAQVAAADAMLEAVRADGTEPHADIVAAIDALRAAVGEGNDGGRGVTLAADESSATARAALETWMLFGALHDAGRLDAALTSFGEVEGLLPEGEPTDDMIGPVVVAALRGALSATGGAAPLGPVHDALLAACVASEFDTGTLVAPWESADESATTPAASPLDRVSPDALAAALGTPLTDAAWEHSPDRDKAMELWRGNGLAGYALYVTRRLEVGALTPDFVQHSLAYLQQREDAPPSPPATDGAPTATSADVLLDLLRAELAAEAPSTERLVGYMEALRRESNAAAPAPAN